MADGPLYVAFRYDHLMALRCRGAGAVHTIMPAKAGIQEAAELI